MVSYLVQSREGDSALLRTRGLGTLRLLRIYLLEGLAMTALAGAALGFLRYNFNPAQIFMGDTGSLFLGLMFASWSLLGYLKTTATVALTVPILLVMAVPLLDTSYAILRRSWARQPIFKPDKGHLHHRLLSTGMSHKQAVVTTGTPFRYIKLNTDLQPIGEQGFFRSPTFWSLLLGPIILIPLAIIFGRKREERANDVRGNRIRKADKLARKYLSEAKKNLGNQQAFYESLERALHNYLKAKLSIQTSEMSKDRISRLLKERGAEEQTSIEFIALLESCEFARYTPSSNTAMQQDYDKASRVISQIDKQV